MLAGAAALHACPGTDPGTRPAPPRDRPDAAADRPGRLTGPAGAG
jgi:hypothetical protein